MAVIVLDGFQLLSLAAVVDPLGLAAAIAGRPLFRLTTLGVAGTDVLSSCGCRIATDAGRLCGSMHFDAVFVCPDPVVPLDPCAEAWLRAQAGRGAEIRFLDDCGEGPVPPSGRPGETPDPMVAAAGRAPARAVAGSGLNLALGLVSAWHGDRLARDVASRLECEWLRLAAVLPDSRLPPMVEIGCDRVRRTLACMRRNLREPVPIRSLAALEQVSLRQLERSFRISTGLSPGSAYVRIRLEAAVRRTVLTGDPLRDIARDAGFRTFASFSRAFVRAYGASPREMRDRAA